MISASFPWGSSAPTSQHSPDTSHSQSLHLQSKAEISMGKSLSCPAQAAVPAPDTQTRPVPPWNAVVYTQLWFTPSSAAGIAAWCSKCCIPPSCPNCRATPKSPRTEPSQASCVLTHTSRTKQAPKSLQDQGLPSLWIIPTQFQVNYYSYTCITWL